MSHFRDRTIWTRIILFFLGLFLFEGREEGREREREKASSPILGNFADIFSRSVDFSIELLIEAFNRKTGLKFTGLTFVAITI